MFGRSNLFKIILISAIILIPIIGFWHGFTRGDCGLRHERFIKTEMNGTVTKLYVDKDNHSIPTIILDNKKFYPLSLDSFYFEIFDYLKVGYQLKKEPYSRDLKVTDLEGKTRIFIEDEKDCEYLLENK